MTITELLHEAGQRLRKEGSPSPSLDAEVLLARCLDVERIDLYARGDLAVEPYQRERYLDAVARRVRGEPVAYIVGKKEFWSLELAVTADTLIPRPDTETVVEEAIRLMKRDFPHGGSILDVGTGSGAIAVALASELEETTITASDISERALLLARENAIVTGTEGRIFFVCTDLFESLTEKFVMIVSNPPYIAEEVYRTLPSGVRCFEPEKALVAGPRGTEFHGRLIRGAPSRLCDGAWLVMEIGEGQWNEVESMFRDDPRWDCIHVVRDLAGNDRVAAARKGS